MGTDVIQLRPGRFLFLTSEEAKARLAPHMSSGNPGQDAGRARHRDPGLRHGLLRALALPRAAQPEREGLVHLQRRAGEGNGLRNGSLQAAYLMIAARSLGLDCGPMSGVKLEGVNAEFFAGTTWEANFICNIGHGTEEHLHPRAPRWTLTRRAGCCESPILPAFCGEGTAPRGRAERAPGRINSGGEGESVHRPQSRSA